VFIIRQREYFLECGILRIGTHQTVQDSAQPQAEYLEVLTLRLSQQQWRKLDRNWVGGFRVTVDDDLLLSGRVFEIPEDGTPPLRGLLAEDVEEGLGPTLPAKAPVRLCQSLTSMLPRSLTGSVYFE